MKVRNISLGRSPIILAASIIVAACAGDAPNQDRQEVDEFAARIGNGSAFPADKVAQPQSSDAPAENEPAQNTAADINPICGSPKVAPFFGRKADNVTREAVLAAVAPNSDVRFIDAGSDVIPVPSSSRLNVKVDAMGVIRSATCG